MSELNLKVQSERLKIPMGGENKKLSCNFRMMPDHSGLENKEE